MSSPAVPIVVARRRDSGWGRAGLSDELLLQKGGECFDALYEILRKRFALGNLPGEYPIPRPLPIYHTDRYVHVPWQGDA